MKAIRIVHTQKRIDRKFKFRRVVERPGQRWGILIGIGILIVGIILLRPASPSDALATVNGEPLTAADLQAYGARMPEDVRMNKQQLLSQAINEQLLLQQAETQGLTVEPSEVDAVIAALLKQRNLRWEDLQQLLQERQLSIDELREAYRRQLLITKLLAAEIPVQVAETQVAQFYLQYQNMFTEYDEATAFEQIRAMLAHQQRQKALPAYVAQLRSESTIEFLPQS
ncbi:MAG TPA: SurA N-terminal domain-containing protein [Candidatus Nanoarchaeia archaeon]|nr:SurA N-terminal domain-containing protein [Candidatus Nanoarchaeia archaeon]